MWEIIKSELSAFSAIVLIFLVPSCLLASIYWQRLSYPFRVLAVFLWFDLFIEIGARVMMHITIDQNNLPLLHLYTLGEFVFWLLFYKAVLTEQLYFKKYYTRIFWTGILAIVANSVFIQGIYEFNSYSKTLVQLTVILLAIDFAFNSFEEKVEKSTARKTAQLINWAVLIYYSGSLFVFMFSSYAKGHWNEGYKYLWDLNIVLNAIFQLLVFIGLCRLIFQTQSSLLSSESVP